MKIESEHVGKECTVMTGSSLEGKTFQAYILNRGDDGLVKIEDDKGVIGWVTQESILEVL